MILYHEVFMYFLLGGGGKGGEKRGGGGAHKATLIHIQPLLTSYNHV